MNILVKEKDSFDKKGFITFKIVDKKTKEVEKVFSVENKITREGATILSHAITGDIRYRVTHIYGEHADPLTSGYIAGSTNGLVESKSDTIDIMRTSPRTTADAESPVVTATYYTSDSAYFHNIVTFSSSWDNPSLDGRLLVGAGLVTKINNAEYLYAHAYFNAILIPSNKEILAHWSQMFY